MKNRNCQIIQRTPELAAIIARCDKENLRREALRKVTRDLNEFVLTLATFLILSLAALN